jgi:hypothetical protein
LKKRGNSGNYFPEPMSVFRNQVSRKGPDIQESLKLLGIKSKNMAFEVNFEGISFID